MSKEKEVLTPPKIKLCKRGHEKIPENVAKNGACKLCSKLRKQTPEYKDYQKKIRQTPEYKEYMKVYKQEHIERIKEQQKAYQQTPKSKAYHKVYYCKNKELIVSKRKVYEQENKEQVSEVRRASYQRHKNQIRIWQKAYRQRPSTKLLVREYFRKYNEKLHDSYVRAQLKLKKEEATPEIIEIKRLTLKLQRSLKNGNQK